MGKSTISMAIFNSKPVVITRGYSFTMVNLPWKGYPLVDTSQKVKRSLLVFHGKTIGKP